MAKYTMVQNVSGTTKDIGGTHFLHIAMFDVEEILNPQTSFDIINGVSPRCKNAPPEGGK